MAFFPWQPEHIERLRVLWDEGHFTAEIARRMGITPNAVIGKAHRLDLPARPSPIRRKDPSELSPTPKAIWARAKRAGIDRPQFTQSWHPRVRAVTLPPLASVAPRKPGHGPAVPRPQDWQDGALAPPRGTCQWVLSGPKPWRFCDQPAAHGTAWCNEHGRRCYVVWPPGPRRGAVSGTWAA